jgi:hypothetical protein
MGVSSTMLVDMVVGSMDGWVDPLVVNVEICGGRLIVCVKSTVYVYPSVRVMRQVAALKRQLIETKLQVPRRMRNNDPCRG